MFGQGDGGFRRVAQRMRPRRNFAGEAFQRRGAQGASVNADRARIRYEREPLEFADEFAVDQHFAGIIDCRRKFLVFTQASHQHTGAPVDKALGQAFVQRVGEFVFDGARSLLPVRVVFEPARPVRYVGPCADMRDTLRNSVDVALGDVQARHVRCDPVVGQHAVMAHQMLVDTRHKARMFFD